MRGGGEAPRDATKDNAALRIAFVFAAKLR